MSDYALQAEQEMWEAAAASDPGTGASSSGWAGGKYDYLVRLALVDGSFRAQWFGADSPPELARLVAADDAVAGFEILQAHRVVV